MARLIIAMFLGLSFASSSIVAPRTTGRGCAGLRVLVFTKTAGFRHESIADGIECARRLSEANGFRLETTEDAAVFTPDRLETLDVVVFLNTTGDVLDPEQEKAFTAWYRNGGGFVGVHSATDTEYDWAWYGDLVGARFARHPAIQPADIEVLTRDHPATRHLSGSWSRTDEWYDFRAAPVDGCRHLLRLDESSYTGGTMGADHPIAWCRAFDGGRTFYTGGGHTRASWREPDFERHVLGGIAWAAGRTLE